MDPQPPAWRVFEAPAGADAAGPSEARGQSEGPKTGPRVAVLGLGVPALAGLGAAVVLGIAAVAIAIGGSGGGTVDGAGLEPAASGSPDAAGQVVVDVAGAVARPGIYRLHPGVRVGDAIAAAGGFGPRVDADRVAVEINLAAPLHDGDRIVVPSRDDAAAGASPGSTAQAGSGLVDLNHASVEELDALPGIGPVTADKIVASRAESPFSSVDDLRSRGLVGQKTFDKLKPLVTVG